MREDASTAVWKKILPHRKGGYQGLTQWGTRILFPRSQASLNSLQNSPGDISLWSIGRRQKHKTERRSGVAVGTQTKAADVLSQVHIYETSTLINAHINERLLSARHCSEHCAFCYLA